MRRRLLVTMAFALVCWPWPAAAQPPATAATQAPAPVPAPSGWTLVFADEFDAPGPPDPAKWGYELGSIRNKEAQFFSGKIEGAKFFVNRVTSLVPAKLDVLKQDDTSAMRITEEAFAV